MLHERILRALKQLCGLIWSWLQETWRRARPWLQDRIGRCWIWLRDAFRRLWQRLQRKLADDPHIERKQRRRKRYYIYTPTEGRSRRLMLLAGGVVLSGVLIFSASKLIGYGMDYTRSRQAADELRRLYYETEETASVSTEVPTAAPTATPSPTPQAEEATPIPAQSPAVTAVPAPTATPISRLATVRYPDNPYLLISERFQKVRRQNKDIVGWLTIDRLLDEAVVQRDNQYYLNRDYLGYHNVNGAVFLDENCDLRTRPYTLMLYGHNMKTGLMFGSLRNYETLAFYRQNPFISFDTMYESGRYVIFSVATISTVPSNWRYVNLSRLLSTSVSLRKEAISQLKRFSLYMNTIDVQPEDQILLLITCVDEETDRRVIAARRIRENESEDGLRQVIRVTTEK